MRDGGLGKVYSLFDVAGAEANVLPDCGGARSNWGTVF
jgi:hypothetical protein